VRPGTGREAGLGHERYIAIEHMDVRRDCVSFARGLKKQVEGLHMYLVSS